MRLITAILAIILLISVLYIITNLVKSKSMKTNGGNLQNNQPSHNKMYGGLGLNEWVIGYTLLPDDFVPDLQPNTTETLMIEYSENWNRAHLIKTFLSAAQCYEREYPNLKIGYSVQLNRFVVINSDIVHISTDQNDLAFIYLKDEQSVAGAKYLNRDAYLAQRICVIDNRQNDRDIKINLSFNNNHGPDPITTQLFIKQGITNGNGNPVYVGFYNHKESPEEMGREDDTALMEHQVQTNTVAASLGDRTVYKYYDWREDNITATKNKFVAINYTNTTNFIQALTTNKTRDSWTETRKLIKEAMTKYSFVFVFFSDDFTGVYIVGWNTLSEMNTVFNYLVSRNYLNAHTKIQQYPPLRDDITQRLTQLNNDINNSNQQLNLGLTNLDSPIYFIDCIINKINDTQLEQQQLEQALNQQLGQQQLNQQYANQHQMNQQYLIALNNAAPNIKNQWDQILLVFGQICDLYGILLNRVQDVTITSINNVLNEINNNIFVTNFDVDTLKLNADNVLNDYLTQYHRNNVIISNVKLKGVRDRYNPGTGDTLRDYPTFITPIITTSNHPNPDSLFKFSKVVVPIRQFSFSIEHLTGLNQLGPFNRGLNQDHYNTIDVRFFNTLRGQIIANANTRDKAYIRTYCTNSRMPQQPAGQTNVNNYHVLPQNHVVNVALN